MVPVQPHYTAALVNVVILFCCVCTYAQDFSVESHVAVTLQEVKAKYKEVLVIDCPPDEELPPSLKVGAGIAGVAISTVWCELKNTSMLRIVAASYNLYTTIFPLPLHLPLSSSLPSLPSPLSSSNTAGVCRYTGCHGPHGGPVRVHLHCTGADSCSSGVEPRGHLQGCRQPTGERRSQRATGRAGQV